LVLKLGLKHEAIHCYPDGHVLFRGEKKNLVNCPHPGCGKSRYIDGSNSIPAKVLRYFPVVDQLKQMFQCPKIAEMMTFHDSNKSGEPLMKSVVDEEQWKHVDEAYPDFAAIPTNLRVGLVGDRVNPYGNQSTKHSVWPILLAIYNLPPWLTTKTFFLKLVMVIPGPQALAAEVVDVYLEPLVEDLLELWEGVPAMDMSKPIGQRHFTLRTMLLWLVHDFPAYGLFSGQQTKGTEVVQSVDHRHVPRTPPFYIRLFILVPIVFCPYTIDSRMREGHSMVNPREMILYFVKMDIKYI